MSEHDPAPGQDPYGVRPGGTPHPSPDPTRGDGASPGRPGRPKLSPEDQQRLDRRRSLSLVLLALTATFSSIVLPPVGLAMGIFTLVMALRLRRAVPRERQSGAMRALQISGASVAIVVGTVLTTVLIVLATELGDAQECLAGANTRVAQERCQDQLMDDLVERFR